MQLSRLERNDDDFQLNMTPTPVRSVLDSAAAICRPHAETKEIAFDIRCDHGITAKMDAASDGAGRRQPVG